MEETLKPALRQAIDFLEKSGHRYAIIGGIALSQWGFARYTHDVDIKVLVPDTDYETVRNELRTVFPRQARINIPEDPFIVAVYIGEVIVDFILALPGYEELIIERAVERDLGGWLAWVCSAEDLIIQKVVANRDKDWPDIEALLIEQHGQLDQNYIVYWLTQFVEVLESQEILARYQRLVEKINSLQ